MKKYTLSNWNPSLLNSGILFFAEAIEEMLFHHSHDSFKVPTLNFKFLCYDIYETIENIENDTLDAGNLCPLIDEFIYSYNKDIIIQELYGNNIKILFSQKNELGEYKSCFEDICKTRTSENARVKLKKVLIYLIEDLNTDNKYYNTLTQKIFSLIEMPLSQDIQDKIYSIAQNFLSELINMGYSIEFLYKTVLHYFFSDKRVENASQIFEEFISTFTFNPKNYVVFFPISSEIKKELSVCFNLEISENVYEMFNNQYPYIGKIPINALDPEQARTNVIEIIDFFLSIVQYDKHRRKEFSIRCVDVVDLETAQSYLLREPIPAILRGKRDKETIFSKTVCPHQIKNLINAISLHATAIKSNDINNQFLNLWTAIEVLIPIDKKGSFSRINQISNHLTTVLSITYFRSLLLHLHTDLSAVNDKYPQGVHDLPGNDINKLACLLFDKNNQIAKDEIINALSSYPILKHRILKYENLLNNPLEMKRIYSQHSKRLQQQIMRIYRTRNMIVHDGSNTVYTDLILQNLHFYLDTLIDAIYALQKYGYKNILSSFKKMSETENTFFQIFEKEQFDTMDIKYICNAGILYHEAP